MPKKMYKGHFRKALNKITSEIMIPSMMNLLGFFFSNTFIENLNFFLSQDLSKLAQSVSLVVHAY